VTKYNHCFVDIRYHNCYEVLILYKNNNKQHRAQQRNFKYCTQKKTVFLLILNVLHLWTTCRSAVDAPWHDLYLYQNLLKYKQVSPEISHSATKALNRHLWHLCSKMIPLTLFSDIASKPELTTTELIGKFTAVHIILMKSRVHHTPSWVKSTMALY